MPINMTQKLYIKLQFIWAACPMDIGHSTPLASKVHCSINGLENSSPPEYSKVQRLFEITVGLFSVGVGLFSVGVGLFSLQEDFEKVLLQPKKVLLQQKKVLF